MPETTHPLIGRSVKYRPNYQEETLETAIIKGVNEEGRDTLLELENGKVLILQMVKLINNTPQKTQKIIMIKGSGIGKTLVAQSLARYYGDSGIPFSMIFARESDVEKELQKLRSFPGFIIIDTPYDHESITPWQTIEITGGGFIDPGIYQALLT